MKYKCEFESEARQQEKHDDGSGVTAIWTDGLMISTCDHREDNLTNIKLKSGKRYKVTIKLEELI